MDSPPILLLLFNRPDLAEKVFEQIAKARPKKLFIAVDGPRPTVSGEGDLVIANREFAQKVDWPCEVLTLFSEENLGCGRAVRSAISWFFEHVDQGIILEDDCLPNDSFFQFTAEMLERYKHDEQVMMVNGTSYLPESVKSDLSYYFSIFEHVWGWATWRRAWEKYDVTMQNFPGSPPVRSRLNGLSPLTRYYMRRNFSKAKNGLIDTWDYQWEHSIWDNLGLAIAPVHNLVSNIGFDERATHTSTITDGRANRPVRPMPFPLSHPETIEASKRLDDDYERRHLMSLPIAIRGFLRKLKFTSGGRN